MSKRIQLRRTKGWRKPKNAIVVSRPSKWGNPFPLSEYLQVCDDDRTAREACVFDFEHSLRNGLLDITIADVRRELRGKDLCCWCPLPADGEPDLCHAAVLLEIANKWPISGLGRFSVDFPCASMRAWI